MAILKRMESGSNVEHGRRHFTGFSIFCIFFMSLGSMSYGYPAAIIGTTLGQPSFLTYMGLDTATNASQLIGAITALFYAGGLVGSFCHGWMSNRFGRRASILGGALMVLISGALLTGSVNIGMFIVFRFFNGWGAFQLLCTVPLWVTEIAPPTRRGMLVDIHAVMLNLGYVVAGYIGHGFYFYSGGNQWRGPMALQMLFPFILICGLWWMPESPRWLLSKDRADEAWAVVQRLHVNPTDPNDHFAEDEFDQMRRQIELDRTFKTSYKEIFTRPSYRKRALITMFLTYSLMSSGVLVINRFGTLDVLLFLTGWTSCAFVFNIVAIAFVDRVLRNRPIALGFFVCTCTLIVEAALQANFLNSNNKGALGAAVAITYLYVVCYSLFLDGPTYFYIGEIWPTHLRAQGYSLGLGMLCLTQIIWSQAAPTAFATIGWTYYIFFVIFAALGCVVSLLLFPDTLHKPLEETAAMFGDEEEVVTFQRYAAGKGGLEGVSTEKPPVPDCERTQGVANAY
ncbi:hypothetical protein LTR66_000490 [Elasticomyces elasticus]|nr:hypothetical protein LTR66_000490 [Elasticomyces elasticus]